MSRSYGCLRNTKVTNEHIDSVLLYLRKSIIKLVLESCEQGTARDLIQQAYASLADSQRAKFGLASDDATDFSIMFNSSDQCKKVSFELEMLT